MLLFFNFSKSLQDQKCPSINIEKWFGKAAKMLYLCFIIWLFFNVFWIHSYKTASKAHWASGLLQWRHLLTL